MSRDSREGVGVTIGLDVGDRRTAACVLDEAGEVEGHFQAATTQSGLLKGLRRYPGARVVLEVGTHSPWMSRMLKGVGYEVIVANPGRVRRIAGMEDKSDRIDAELLARLGRVDPKLLRPIEHRGEQAQRDRGLLRVRDGLVRSRSGLVTQARCIAKSLGERLPSCDAQSFARRLRSAGLDGMFPGLEGLVRMVEELTREIAALDVEISRMCRERYAETKLLRGITGVGPITALALVLAIDDVSRFRRSRDVGAYFGLRPRRYQSGGQDPELRISKAGDRYARRMLVQASHYILGPFGPDTALRRFGERLVMRGGKAAHKKAVIAVARKLAVMLHRMWVTGEEYEPMRGVKMAEAA